MKPLLRRWASGDDLWLRRAAMLCQRRHRARGLRRARCCTTTSCRRSAAAASPASSSSAKAIG
ncbi:MAG: DNA alkylation repair protein [Comamonadaceae bacterium]|nr:DNA alkylation repair protein [Comamonadaceae bacterium]